MAAIPGVQKNEDVCSGFSNVEVQPPTCFFAEEQGCDSSRNLGPVLASKTQHVIPKHHCDPSLVNMFHVLVSLLCFTFWFSDESKKHVHNKLVNTIVEIQWPKNTGSWHWLKLQVFPKTSKKNSSGYSGGQELQLQMHLVRIQQILVQAKGASDLRRISGGFGGSQHVESEWKIMKVCSERV